MLLGEFGGTRLAAVPHISPSLLSPVEGLGPYQGLHSTCKQDEFAQVIVTHHRQSTEAQTPSVPGLKCTFRTSALNKPRLPYGMQISESQAMLYLE